MRNTTIYKSAEVEIEMDDVKEFIDNCDDKEVKEIVKYCNINLEIETIPVSSLQDLYKVKALKEIWNDLSIEDIENIVSNYKSKNGR